MTRAVDFWFSIGSTYTYLSVLRADDLAHAHGIALRWRPFSVRTIIREIGNTPFQGRPAKMAYMWRDMERRAGRYGIPIRVPAPYPLEHLDVANQVAVVGEQEGWCADYARAAYRLWFQQAQPPGEEPNLSASLAECGQDPARVLALARSGAILQAYDANTDAARELGIFGAPTFAVDGEIFWGDDRLEDALDWARHGQLTRAGAGSAAD